MRKTPAEILKELLPVLLVSLVIPIFLNFFLEVAGLGSKALFIPNDFKAVDPTTMEAGSPNLFSFLPSLNLTLFGLAAFVAQILSNIIGTLIKAGASLCIYRKIKYDTEVKIEDLFFFFSQRIGFNLLTFIAVFILTVLGLLVFIIPGIIISLGLYTVPVLLAKAKDTPGVSIPQILKDTWATTKGHKGMIFGKLLVFGIISGVISGGVGFFLTLVLGESLLDSTSIVAVVIYPLIMSILGIFTGLIMYIAEIDIYQELIGKRVFDQEIEEEYVDEEIEILDQSDRGLETNSEQEKKDFSDNSDKMDQ